MASSGEDIQEQAAALVMPPKIALVREAIARLDTLGQRGGPRSKILSLDAVTMEHLCERLADRQIAWIDTHKWLNKELASEGDEEEIIKQDVIYRFKNHFTPVFEQVRAEHAQRIARLTVDQATAGSMSLQSRVLKHRLISSLTERMIGADSLEDLKPAELNAMLNMLKALDEGDHKQQELALKIADSDRKAQKLEADLRKAELELEDLQRKLDKVEKAKQDAVAAAQQTVTEGGGADAVIAKVRDLLGIPN